MKMIEKVIAKARAQKTKKEKKNFATNAECTARLKDNENSQTPLLRWTN